MIIGRDLLMSCKIDIRFSDNSITWGSARVPFQKLKSIDPYESTNERAVIPPMTQTQRCDAAASMACQTHGRRRLHTKTWNQRMNAWLHAEYKRVFDSSIERWVVDDQKLLTVEGLYSHGTEFHQQSSLFLESMRMEFDRLNRLQVFTPMVRPPWHVQRNETSRRMIFDSQHQSATTLPYTMATHVDISHLVKMHMSPQLEPGRGYNFRPQTLHYKVRRNLVPMGSPVPAITFNRQMRDLRLSNRTTMMGVDDVLIYVRCYVSREIYRSNTTHHHAFIDEVEATDVKARIRLPCRRPVTAKATSPEVSCYGRSLPPGVPDGTSTHPPLHRTEATDIRARIRYLHPPIYEGCPFYKGITEHPLCSIPSSAASEEATNKLANGIPRQLATDIRARISPTGAQASSSSATCSKEAPPRNGATTAYRISKPGYTPCMIGNEMTPISRERLTRSSASPTFEATDIRSRIQVLWLSASWKDYSYPRGTGVPTGTKIGTQRPIYNKQYPRYCLASPPFEATDVHARIRPACLTEASSFLPRRMDTEDYLPGRTNTQYPRYCPASPSFEATDIRDRIRRKADPRSHQITKVTPCDLVSNAQAATVSALTPALFASTEFVATDIRRRIH